MIIRARHLCLLAALACGGDAPAPSDDTTAPPVDRDADGLTDADEAARGTDPASADSDADGLTDGGEVSGGSDPLLADTDADGWDDDAELACGSLAADPARTCYTCGWPLAQDPPIDDAGPALGDRLADLALTDQCGEPYHLTDLAGEWAILYITTAWCGTCIDDAVALQGRADVFFAETGIRVRWAFVVFQDASGNPPSPTYPATMASSLDLWDFPVLADPTRAVVTATPFGGDTLPGRCLLSPDRRIVLCNEGEAGDGALFDRVRAGL